MNAGKTLAIVGGGLGLLLLGYSLFGGDDSSSSSTSGGSNGSGGSGSNGSTPPPTLEQLAGTLRDQYLVVSACDITWKNGDASKSGLQSHVQDFFVPALARARATGANTVDAAAAAVAQLLVPGCVQPPSALAGISIDDALAGKLHFGAQAAFGAAQMYGTVQFYLAVRAVVSALMATRR